uniref:Receptor expression-enhancing protein n=1 Tax=Steinernema glaseri TaxID=37863 RepID=A0A1I8AH47_9BILA
MVLGFLTRAATAVIGTLLPAYRTYRCHEKSSAREMRHWLRYWTVYGLSTFAESAAKAMFLDYLIPGSDLLLLLYACWCSFPVAGGTDQMYVKLIRPFLRKNEASIDAAISTFSSSFRERLMSAVSAVGQQIVNAVIGSAYSNPAMGAVHAMQIGYTEGTPSRPSIQGFFEEEQEDDMNVVYVKEEPLDDGYEVHDIQPTPHLPIDLTGDGDGNEEFLSIGARVQRRHRESTPRQPRTRRRGRNL